VAISGVGVARAEDDVGVLQSRLGEARVIILENFNSPLNLHNPDKPAYPDNSNNLTSLNNPDHPGTVFAVGVSCKESRRNTDTATLQRIPAGDGIRE
jgi:hypothetical protein